MLIEQKKVVVMMEVCCRWIGNGHARGSKNREVKSSWFDAGAKVKVEIDGVVRG